MTKQFWAIVMADPWKKEFWSTRKSGGGNRYRTAKSQVFLPVMAGDAERRKRKVALTVFAVLVVLAGLADVAYRRFSDPAQAKLSYNSGVILLQADSYDAAILYFDRAIALKSGFADAYHMRARAYAAINREDPAIADFTKFAKFKPQNPTLMIERGFAYLVKKDYSQAIADATAAIALDAKLTRAYDLRATAIRATGNARKALEDYTIAVGLDPNLDHYFQRAATYQLLGEHRLAISDLDQAVALSPHQPDIYYARAKSKMALGDNHGATEDIQLAEYIRFGQNP